MLVINFLQITVRQVIPILLLCFILIPDKVSGQDFIQLTVRDGLPSNLVYGAIKDKDGFIWFFTDNGVAKYDGYGFKIFNKDNGIVNEDIWQMHEDKYGRKWLISAENIGYYIQNDSIKKIELTNPNIFVRPQNVHYFDEGLIYKQEKTISIIAGDELLEVDKSEWKSDAHFIQLLNDSQHLRKNREKIVKYLIQEDFDLDINMFLSQSARSLYGNIYNFKTKDLNFEFNKFNSRLNINKKGKRISFDLTKADVDDTRAMCKNGDILGIHHTKGYLEINLETEEITQQYSLGFVDHKLTRTLVDDQFLIAGSFYDGAIISSVAPPIPKYLTDESINTISLNGEDGIMVVTDDSGLYHFNINDHDFKKQDFKSKYLTNENVLKLDKKSYMLYEQTIWDLTEVKKIYQGNRDSIISDFGNLSDLYLNNSKDIHISDSIISILRFNIFFSIKKGNHIHRTIRNENIDFSCFEPFKGDIFFGSNKGLFFVADGQAIRPSSLDSHEDFNITDLLNVKDEKLAIVSDNTKLHFLDENKLTEITNFDSPIVELCTGGEYLYGLAADHLFRVNMSEGMEVQKFYFQTISGLDKITCLESTDEMIFMGTESGFYQFHHDELKPMTESPRLIELGLHSSKGHIEGEDFNHINTTDNNLQFRFKALSIISLGNIEYSYRLLPNESKWKKTRELEANYTSLSANDYTFEIYTTDAFGNKSEVEQLQFSVASPWYESMKFYILASLILIGLISLFYWFRIDNIRKAEKRKTLINQKIARYELQALRAQMNPHFIFNVLSSIQNAIRNQNVETADDYLYNFANLIRKFLDYSDRRFLSLQEEIELIRLYTNIENLRFRPKIEIQFDIDETVDSENTIIPSMLIQPIVENAINHGLFYKKNDRKLRLSIKTNEDDISVIIEDNGVGRDESKKNNRSRATNHSSKGLLNIQNRIEILNQSEEVKIAYEVDDLKDNDNVASGTRVRLLIQYHDSNSRNSRR